jgi:hypothetical protein
MTMTDTLLELTATEFANLYTLVPNHLNPDCGFGPEGAGCLFDTSAEELAFVMSQPPQRIWTLVDDGDLYLMSGYHLADRLGYLISRTDVPAGTEIRVCIDTASAE